jgi:thioredoxin reductase (NADPH)
MGSKRGTTLVDCLVVGAGPAGLTAATYLGRFLREVTVIDAGESRLKRVPLSRNIPGFPDGVAGKELHARMIEQATTYGASLIDGQVHQIGKDGESFQVRWTGGLIVARTVLLATGVHVVDPDVAGLETAIQKGAIRYCPICDGFEAAGSRIAVLGARPHSIDEARFLRTYSDDITFVTLQNAVAPTSEEVAVARRAGIQVEDRACVGLTLDEGKVRLEFAMGDSTIFDVVYPCLGSKPRSELARAVGAALSKDGELLTDKHQRTNVPGLFAAGDVLHGLDQVASACGQAAIAATAMHNLLRAT